MSSYFLSTLCYRARIFYFADMQRAVKLSISIPYSRSTQLILTQIQLEKFSISRGPVEFLISNDKNETIITCKYRKMLGFSHCLH